MISDPKSLARALAADRSKMAILPGNPEQLEMACGIAIDAVESAFSLRTAKQDLGAWKAWKRYCKLMKTPALREPVDPITNRDGYLREVVLLVNALTHFIKTKTPKLKASRLAGFTIQPQSAMNVLLAVNRVLKRNYSSFIPLKSISLALKGMMRKFIRDFGPTSLVPKRREPFTNGLIKNMTEMPSGASLGRFGVLDWESTKGLSLLAAFALAVSSGFRKSELFESDEETTFMSWALISWHIRGSPVKDPTDAQLAALTEGDFMLVTPPPSKADPFNTVWGALPVYVPFHNTKRNAARAVAALALKLGPANRKKGPVFVDNARAPLKTVIMADAMFHWVKRFVGEESAKLYTWHSGRIFLACALSAQNVKPATIQTMLRWQTEESLRTYARMGMNEYAANLDSAAEACVASVQTANLPLYERFDLFLALNRTMESQAEAE